MFIFPHTQVNVFDEAAKQNPDAWWWVKLMAVTKTRD